MEYSYEYKRMCVELYRQGKWPETPAGTRPSYFVECSRNGLFEVLPVPGGVRIAADCRILFETKKLQKCRNFLYKTCVNWYTDTDLRQNN